MPSLRMSPDWLSRGKSRIPSRNREQEHRGPSGLPEYHKYEDKGCVVAPACLSCPLEECIYVLAAEGRPIRYTQNEERDEAIRLLGRRGVERKEIAEMYGLSKRSVFRILAERARM